MELGCIKAIKIKVRVGDAILFKKEVKGNLPDVTPLGTDTPTVATNTDSRAEFVSEGNQLALDLQFRPDNSAVGIHAKENDIRIAGIHP